MVSFNSFIKYSAVLFLFMVLTGFLKPSKFIFEENINYYSVIVDYIFESTGVVVIFYMHARRQLENVYANVVAIFVVYNMVSCFLMFLIDNQTPNYFGLDVALDLTILMVSTVFGTEFGKYINKIKLMRNNEKVLN